ncbi:hypothetical protein GHT06_007897 [Daphnia sinensis]|uniref:Chitin-binding type-2 domain-containing protein n=1 Tax=Daphnia sinensis TaxID=1820382 RepID=A0AAD5L2M9_9CRUS|nr:hypothetical protein GHT06_007897 [Daphnia sinensis]
MLQKTNGEIPLDLCQLFQQFGARNSKINNRLSFWFAIHVLVRWPNCKSPGTICTSAITLVYSLPALHRAKRWEEFPNVTLTFDCTDRPLGFYADQEFECMLFHMCDEDGRRIPYMCGSGTAFNQQYRICDWIHNFDCKEANKWFYLNELTYVTDPPKIATA